MWRLLGLSGQYGLNAGGQYGRSDGFRDQNEAVDKSNAREYDKEESQKAKHNNLNSKNKSV